LRLPARRIVVTLAAMVNQPDHVRRNRVAWDQLAASYAGPGAEAWAEAEPHWGTFGVPEAEAGVLPPDVAGLDAIELGCGTAYVSAWLARRGARPVGIDNSAAQLATAAGLQERFKLRFPLLHASAEQVPLEDASFDLAISEYGAAIWCDPYAWIPEAARLLRPGGELIFLGNSVQYILSVPDEDGLPPTDRLLRPFFGMHRFEWPGDDADDSVEFHLGHGDMIRLLRRTGLVVTDLIELQAPAGAANPSALQSAEWAHQWPCEEVWKARKPG
jgi:SAM-dependent methyltransferase